MSVLLVDILDMTISTSFFFKLKAMIGVNRVATFLAHPDANPDSVLHIENEGSHTIFT